MDREDSSVEKTSHVGNCPLRSCPSVSKMILSLSEHHESASVLMEVESGK